MMPATDVPHRQATCHPEWSLAKSEANRETQSKDPYHQDTAWGQTADSRIEIGFFDEQNAEVLNELGCEAVVYEKRQIPKEDDPEGLCEYAGS